MFQNDETIEQRIARLEDAMQNHAHLGYDFTKKLTFPDQLPSQTGNSGKFLTTNGTIASWGTIDVSNFGGDGSDGAYSATTGNVDFDLGAAQYVVKNYTTFSITGNVICSNPHSTGTILHIKVQGDVTLSGGGDPILDLSGMGAANNTTSWGILDDAEHCGSGATADVPGARYTNRNFYTIASRFAHRKAIFVVPGSGGANGNAGSELGGGGAGSLYGAGGAGRTTSTGAGSAAGGNSAGGGGGLNTGSSGAGTGGKGGGALIIECGGTLTINASSGNAVFAKGAAGGGGNIKAGGGGGAGGMILIIYNAIGTNSGALNDAGGAGGSVVGGAGGAAGGSTGGLLIENTEFI